MVKANEIGFIIIFSFLSANEKEACIEETETETEEDDDDTGEDGALR